MVLWVRIASIGPQVLAFGALLYALTNGSRIGGGSAWILPPFAIAMAAVAWAQHRLLRDIAGNQNLSEPQRNTWRRRGTYFALWGMPAYAFQHYGRQSEPTA